MIIGVLFNMAAGGSSSFGTIGSILVERLSSHEILTCDGGLGEDFLPSARSLPIKAHGYVPRIRQAVVTLIAGGIDILACVGGDGFASYCAEFMMDASPDLPLLGIAGGTENSGPLIGFDRQSILDLDPGLCVIRPVGALECSCGKDVLGYAFNDMVIGDTFLGSIAGKKVNISLETFLATGEKNEHVPSHTIAGPGFHVKKNGVRVGSHLATRHLILAAPLNHVDFYRGKAALGAPCIAYENGGRAVLAISDRNWIDIHSPAHDSDFCAIEHLLFGPGDLVEIGGLAPTGHLVIDGNPFRREGETVALKLHDKHIRVILPARRKGAMLVPVPEGRRGKDEHR